jgi:RimJ/RimL family protein N-acetyltransferase
MSEPVYLRSLEPDDIERLHRWHNDPSLYEALIGTFRYVSRSAEEEWLRHRLAYSAQEVNLAICRTENEEHIGSITLRGIDWVSRHADLGVFIASPEHRLKGYGQAAIRLMTRHAFHDLGLRRLCLSVLADNVPAIHAYEKCGFQVEGTLRRHVFKRGAFLDVMVMGLCIEDWQSEDTTNDEKQEVGVRE